MARFLALTKGGVFFLAASCAGMLALSAAPAPTNAPAATPPHAPATNAAAAKPVPPPAVPPPFDDYYVRYGKILTPSPQSTEYPFKLNMPFPDVGAVKVPSREELEVRDKIEQLAALSDDEIRQQLMQWPAFARMSLADDGAMFQRIQAFRDYRRKAAIDAWRRLGLTLTPDQQARFEKDYWDRKLQLDRQLAQQLEPAFKAAQQKLNEDLFREFSTPGGLVHAAPPPPKPPAPKPSPPKPPAVTSTNTPTLAH
jgi:hypothetical protein